jgi:hypothetical protein
MNPKELRIGNILSMDGKLCIVKGINTDNFILAEWLINPQWTWGEPIECFSGVTITEEWLLKFSFEKRILNGIIPEYSISCTPPNYKNEYRLCFRFNEIRDSDIIRNYWSPYMRSGTAHSFKLDFVHQLQNLYFSLTGNELYLD